MLPRSAPPAARRWWRALCLSAAAGAAFCVVLMASGQMSATGVAAAQTGADAGGPAGAVTSAVMDCDTECVTATAGACAASGFLVATALLLSPRRRGGLLRTARRAPGLTAPREHTRGRPPWTVLTPTRLCLLRV